MQMHGPRLIALTGCVSDLVAPAWGYMRVRAWSMPPILYTLVGMVRKTPFVSYGVLGACSLLSSQFLACVPCGG